MMIKGHPEGRIFLSRPHMNNGLFSLLTTKYLVVYWKTLKRLKKTPKYAEMRHGDGILTLQRCHGLTCSQRAVDVRLFGFFLSFHRLVWVCEIELVITT